MSKPAAHCTEQMYRIGAVSRLTGISVDTLRIWERRYSVVTPAREQGSHRLYNSAQINRLSILKTLVDRGDAIGRIARLSLEELSQRLYLMRQFKTSAYHTEQNTNTVKVAVYGQFLPLQLPDEDESPDYEFIIASRSLAEFKAAIGKETADIIVLEYPSIQATTLDEIGHLQRLNERAKFIVIYGFTKERLLQQLMQQVTICKQAPVSVDSLFELIDSLRDAHQRRNHRTVATGSASQARLYTNEQLTQLTDKANIVGCECPLHLVGIIKKLVEFEIYSGECESLDDRDKQLHSYLGNITGQARFLMEQALAHVVEHDSLEMH